MYYRGSRVSLSERKPRFHSTGVWKKNRGVSEKENQLFVKWFGPKEKPVVHEEKKTYAFYRPGVTPVDDTPTYSKKKGSWVLKAPALQGAQWVLRLAGIGLLILVIVLVEVEDDGPAPGCGGVEIRKGDGGGDPLLVPRGSTESRRVAPGREHVQVGLDRSGRKGEKDGLGGKGLHRKAAAQLHFDFRAGNGSPWPFWTTDPFTGWTGKEGSCRLGRRL